MSTVISGAVRPRSGDLVLAEIRRLGQHRRLELTNGRRSTLHVGDHIVVAYADRYAPDQFESHVPNDLRPVQLVASGGIASHMLSRSADVRSATDIVPVGLIGDDRGTVLNLADFAIDGVADPVLPPRTIAVIGTSMNSGKTTTVHYLVHTLTGAGHRVGATKVTGTGSGGDYWVMLDSGAHSMLDFTDAGMASTFRMPMQRVEHGVRTLLNATAASGVVLSCVEVADGVYQQETSQLLESNLFYERVDAIIFAAADAMGAVAGVQHLTALGHEVLAVSGRLTRAPLAAREAEQATGLPVLGRDALESAEVLERLVGIQPVAPRTPPALLSAPAAEVAPAAESMPTAESMPIEPVDLEPTSLEPAAIEPTLPVPMSFEPTSIVLPDTAESVALSTRRHQSADS